MVRLGDICEIQSGGTPARSKRDYWENGTIPWVKISDIKGKHLENTEEFITDEGLKNSSAKVFPKGTILYTIFATLGETCILNIDAATNQAIAGITIKSDGVHREYLYYYLSSLKSEVNQMGRGVAQNNINMSILRNLPIQLPPLDEQRRIAATLDKVTDLIAKRHQQLDKLDELVKARFVEMFGDPESNDKNWPVLPMSKICSVGSSKRIYQSEQSSSGVPFWRISDLTNLITTGTVTSELYIPEERYKKLKSQGQVPAPSDILITSRGTLGQCYIVKANDKFYFQDGMISWLSGYVDGVTPLYISYLFMMPGFRKQIDSMQAGSTVAYLSIAMIKKLKVMLPDIESQQQFASFVGKTEKAKTTISRSLEKLETLKKALMQEYFEVKQK